MQQDTINKMLNYQGNTFASSMQCGTEDLCPPYQPPPPYASESTTNVELVIPTADELYRRAKIATPITSKLRLFLLISGGIYSFWSLAIIALEIFIALRSEWTSYRSVWPSVLILAASVKMSIVGCRMNYKMIHLIRFFDINLLFCIYGITFSAINYHTSKECFQNRESCDNPLVMNLKIVSLVLTIVATIHTMINSGVVRNAHKKAAAIQDP